MLLDLAEQLVQLRDFLRVEAGEGIDDPGFMLLCHVVEELATARREAHAPGAAVVGHVDALDQAKGDGSLQVIAFAEKPVVVKKPDRKAVSSAIAMPAITNDRNAAWTSCCVSDRSVSDSTRSAKNAGTTAIRCNHSGASR